MLAFSTGDGIGNGLNITSNIDSSAARQEAGDNPSAAFAISPAAA